MKEEFGKTKRKGGANERTPEVERRVRWSTYLAWPVGKSVSGRRPSSYSVARGRRATKHGN